MPRFAYSLSSFFLAVDIYEPTEKTNRLHPFHRVIDHRSDTILVCHQMFRMTAMLCVRPVLRSLHIQLEWNLKTNFLTSSKTNSFFLVQIFRSSKINIINERRQ